MEPAISLYLNHSRDLTLTRHRHRAHAETNYRYNRGMQLTRFFSEQLDARAPVPRGV